MGVQVIYWYSRHIMVISAYVKDNISCFDNNFELIGVINNDVADIF